MELANCSRQREDGAPTTFFALFLSLALVLVFSALLVQSDRDPDGPKRLWHPISGFNTFQFITNSYKFMTRVQRSIRRETVLRVKLGFKAVYFVSGTQGIITDSIRARVDPQRHQPGAIHSIRFTYALPNDCCRSAALGTG